MRTELRPTFYIHKFNKEFYSVCVIIKKSFGYCNFCMYILQTEREQLTLNFVNHVGVYGALTRQSIFSSKKPGGTFKTITLKLFISFRFIFGS